MCALPYDSSTLHAVRQIKSEAFPLGLRRARKPIQAVRAHRRVLKPPRLLRLVRVEADVHTIAAQSRERQRRRVQIVARVRPDAGVRSAAVRLRREREGHVAGGCVDGLDQGSGRADVVALV